MKRIAKVILASILVIIGSTQMVFATGNGLDFKPKGDIVFNSTTNEHELNEDESAVAYESNYEINMELTAFWDEVMTYVELIESDPSQDLNLLSLSSMDIFTFLIELDPSLVVDETILYANFETTMQANYPEFAEVFDSCYFYYNPIAHTIFVGLGANADKTGVEIKALNDQGKLPMNLGVTFPEGSIYLPAENFNSDQEITSVLSECRQEASVFYNNEARLGTVSEMYPATNATYTMRGVSPTTTYTVDFDSVGGTAVASITGITSGDTIAEPTAPTKANNTFDGWYTDTTYTVEWNFASDVVTADTTLYAKWIPNAVPQTYTVDFDSVGGTAVASITGITSGDTIAEPTAPTKANNTFDGWYTDTTYTVEWNFTSDVVTADTTLYAKWVPARIVNPADPAGPSTPDPEATNPTVKESEGVDTMDTTNLGFLYLLLASAGMILICIKRKSEQR